MRLSRRSFDLAVRCGRQIWLLEVGKPRVIVTRPAIDAAHWAQLLSQQGFNARILPLIEIGPISNEADVQALQTAWQGLADYAACMFVSGNAVQYFFEQNRTASHIIRAQTAPDNIAKQAIYALPTSLRFLAPGPGTAAALMASGVAAAQIDSPPLDAAQFDSQALWQVIGQRDWQAARVLVIRGQTDAALEGGVGRDWLAQQWRTRGAQVDFINVYERRPPQLSAEQLNLARIASQDGSVWLFSSSEAIANLIQQPGLQSTNWSQARAIATHPRIADAARLAGWGVVQESRPALADIVLALRSIESGVHE